MKRRTFLSLFVAFAFTPTALLAGTGTADYASGLIKKELVAGKTLFVSYAADWCSTCKTQERAINKLRAENPKFNENITFIRVDWDEFNNKEVTTSRNIPRRSTLVVLKGDQELGRIVAGTSSTAIKELLEKAL